MQRTRRLFDEVRARTGYDIRRQVRIIVCDDEKKFLSIQEKMRGKNYRFPRDTDNIGALYFSEDRCIAISPDVKPGTTSFDRIVLHEMFHDLMSHEISQDTIKHLMRSVSRRRREVLDAYSSVDRKMPWSTEERLCDLFGIAICPHTQRGWSKMKRISLNIMEPILI